MDFDLRAHTHLLVIGGSRAYGTHTAASDVDVKGVAIPPAHYFLGFHHRFDQADDAPLLVDFLQDLTPAEAASHQVEGSVYNLVKFARLATDANPNLYDVLFCRDAEVRRITPVGEALRANRRMFLSARARYTFAGYAMSQLRRIRGHRRWLLSPPKGQPKRGNFGLPERTLIPADQLSAAEAAIRKKLDGWEIDYGELDRSQVLRIEDQVSAMLAELAVGVDERWFAAGRLIGLDDNLMAVLDRERRYKAALSDWNQYLSWKRSRNPARAALEAKHGYDTKHGAHLVRLLRMGREIVETGEVHVWRGDRDADELLAIRQGAWSYDALVTWAEEQEQQLRSMEKAGGFVVPAGPDHQAIDALVADWVRQAIL